VSDQSWRVTVTCPAVDTELVAARLVTATGQGVEEPERGRLLTVLPDEASARDLATHLLSWRPDLSASVEAIASVDWSLHWRDGITTRRFGRLVLTPSWIPVTPASGEHCIVIDPESAFGSGGHGSTRGVLTLLERLMPPGATVLDLGSGSGILAIAAVVLGATRAIGIEVDDEAMPVAEANALRNGVSGCVQFITGDAKALVPLLAPADVICSNILRNVNTELLPTIAAALARGGIAIFSGMEASEAELFRPRLLETGLRIRDEVVDEGWWAVAAERG